MGSVWRDLKYALRTLTRNPGFTAIAILSLALGIGANTAIFTLTDAVFLHPLPIEDSARVQAFGQDARQRGFAHAKGSFDNDMTGRLRCSLGWDASALGGRGVVSGHSWAGRRSGRRGDYSKDTSQPGADVALARPTVLGERQGYAGNEKRRS